MRCDLSSLTKRPSGRTRRICASKFAHCCGAVEVLEHREAALQQVGAERLRLAIGEVPETGLPHVGDRILEQLGIVERQNQAAVGADVERGQRLEDAGQVLLGARVVVIPRGAEPAARKPDVGLPAQPHERELAVVGDIGALRRARGVELDGRRGCRRGSRTAAAMRQPLRHAGIIPEITMPSLPSAAYRFGPFSSIGPPTAYLEDGRPLDLTPKLLDLLLHLLDHAGTLVTKEALLDALWPGTSVTDNALAQAVSELRQALGDDAGDPRLHQDRRAPRLSLRRAGRARGHPEDAEQVADR